MVQQANPARGEAMLRVAGEQYLLRPSFTALVAAEEEVGSLFALVERAAAGELRLAEMEALFWQVIDARPESVTREAAGEAVLGMGLAGATPVLKLALRQILVGREVGRLAVRSEEHTSELKSLMRSSYDVCCLKNKNVSQQIPHLQPPPPSN